MLSFFTTNLLSRPSFNKTSWEKKWNVIKWWVKFEQWNVVEFALNRVFLISRIFLVVYSGRANLGNIISPMAWQARSHTALQRHASNYYVIAQQHGDLASFFVEFVSFLRRFLFWMLNAYSMIFRVKKWTMASLWPQFLYITFKRTLLA